MNVRCFIRNGVQVFEGSARKGLSSEQPEFGLWRLLRHPVHIALLVQALVLFPGGGICSADQRPAGNQDRKVVALVNGERILLAEVDQVLASQGPESGSGERRAREQKEELLERLIDTRLVVQEAKRIGLDELPEIRKMVDVFSRVTLRDELTDKQVRNVKASAKEVERLYKAAVAEWKINSVIFKNADDATRMVAELKESKAFEELATNAVAANTAKSGSEARYIRVKEINPEIADVVSKMKPGTVSPVMPTKAGFVLVKLETIRHPDSIEERKRARAEALKSARAKALDAYNRRLVRRYVTIHRNVLDQIDYESKEPGFQELLKDKRVIAEIEGENPITVGDLTEQLRQGLYHGVERAVESKRLSSKKAATLDELLHKRVFRKEALRLGLDKTDSYRTKVRAYENSLVFGAFVQKAVVPDVKLKEEDVKAFYEEHISDYSFPEMVRILGLPFGKRGDAEAAVEKLRNGTDFQWLTANAEGQVDRNSKGLLVFDERLLTTPGLPEGLRKVITGSKPGDLRLYAAPEGYFYALSIQDAIPSMPKPYEEARGEIAKKLFDERLRRAMDEYIAKLRAAADIKVFLKP